MGDWPQVLAMEKATPASDLPVIYRQNPRVVAAIALAHAHLGDFPGAESWVARADPACDECRMARGKIAEMEGNPGRADYWFARVEKTQLSIPFADAAWGQALLARGQPDAAIAKFTLATKKGPHFADPIEGWGEALMAKNQSHRALAKFEEAAKYAPNWGRLHLKWGEALTYAGKKDEAVKQFGQAAMLDLTGTEKSELEKDRP
jgi:tetratricopeptide (TPR) repeat protein